MGIMKLHPHRVVGSRNSWITNTQSHNVSVNNTQINQNAYDIFSLVAHPRRTRLFQFHIYDPPYFVAPLIGEMFLLPDALIVYTNTAWHQNSIHFVLLF